ncbi:hypothetical protein SFRURICE_011327 [Spodoptera frugiperda]|nr:hypothetical protein SFRURICE_011327 [Spodoptera frugiperda]
MTSIVSIVSIVEVHSGRNVTTVNVGQVCPLGHVSTRFSSTHRMPNQTYPWGHLGLRSPIGTDSKPGSATGVSRGSGVSGASSATSGRIFLFFLFFSTQLQSSSGDSSPGRTARTFLSSVSLTSVDSCLKNCQRPFVSSSEGGSQRHSSAISAPTAATMNAKIMNLAAMFAF